MRTPIELLESELISLQRKRRYKLRTDTTLEEIASIDKQIEAVRATLKKERGR